MTRFANVFLASIFFVALSACSDLEGDANALFVEVATELQAAEETSGLVEYQLLQAAQKKLVRLTTPEFSRTAVAVKVVSGNKVGPLSADELRARLAILEGTPEVCGAIRTVACATRLIAATPLKIPAPIRDEQVRLLVELALYSNLAGIQAPVERIMQTVPTVADGQRFALDFASSAALGRVSETVFPRLTAAAILDYSSAVSADFGPVLDNRFTIFSLGDGLRLLQEPETMIAVVSGWPEASRASAAMSLLPAARKLPLPQRLEVMDAIFASLSLPEDRKRGLASYAIGGEEQLAEALSIAANDERNYQQKRLSMTRIKPGFLALRNLSV